MPLGSRALKWPFIYLLHFGNQLDLQYYSALQCQPVKVVGKHGRPSYLKGAKQAIRAIKVVGSMTQLAKYLAHLAVEL